MKTAEEWLIWINHQDDEFSVIDPLIQEFATSIQADALRHAAYLCHTLDDVASAHALEKEADKLETK